MSEFEERIRSAFEGELEKAPAPDGLRERVIAKAVQTPQPRGLGAWLAGPRLGGPRLMTLAGAAAAVVIVAAGVGVYLSTRSGPPVARTQPSAPAFLAFGKLPAPGFPPTELGGGGGPQPSVIPYFGPAVLSWSGRLPALSSSAPVFRFTLPGPADADALAARLHATPEAPGSVVKTYRTPDGWHLSIGFGDPLAQQPTFTLQRDLSPPAGPLPSEAAVRAAAADELSRLGLTPSWRSRVSVDSFTAQGQNTPIFVVTYERLIALGGDTARQVDGSGDPAGIHVTVDAGARVVGIAGVVPAQEETAAYGLRSGTSAVQTALSAPATAPGGNGAVPAVSLSHAELVYQVVESEGQGFLEPAYLFTGTFQSNGQTFEKRVLVPAVLANAIRS